MTPILSILEGDSGKLCFKNVFVRIHNIPIHGETRKIT